MAILKPCTTTQRVTIAKKRFCIGSISEALKSWVKWFDSSTYLSTGLSNVHSKVDGGIPLLPAIVLLLSFVVVPAQAKSINQSDFLNWDYAVWAWENLKTGKAYDAEWDKVDKPYSAWRKLNKRSPEQALKALENNSDLELIKKGQALDLAYLWWADRANSNRSLFWQVFEPNCYEGGEMYGMVYEKNGYRFTDEWAQMNIFTGKCDWPDWRGEKGVSVDIQNRAEFMGNLKLYTKNGKH